VRPGLQFGFLGVVPAQTNRPFEDAEQLPAQQSPLTEQVAPAGLHFAWAGSAPNVATVPRATTLAQMMPNTRFGIFRNFMPIFLHGFL